MADINVEMLREKLYKAAIALSCIGEVCVDVSKQHISAERAIDKIRNYLHDTDAIGSRYRVDRLIEDCTIGECSRDEIARQIFEDYFLILDKNNIKYYDYPACCDGCSNNPKNGGSGICNCTLPYMQNPTLYNTGDSCMANNIDGRVYFTNTDNLKEHKANYDRIIEAVERTKKYIKE